jgi:OOP family OmpA-OmpF porin
LLKQTESNTLKISKLLRSLTFIIFIFQIGIFHSQDLIVNGSFESYSHCPCNYSDMPADNWKSISAASPDLHSTCANKKCQGHPKVSNKVLPASGKAYAGIIVHEQSFDYREYLGSELLDSLYKDSIYQLKISLAIPRCSIFKTSNFDIAFTRHDMIYESTEAIVGTPSLSINIESLKFDELWVTFEAEYKANGGERHISIGNFRPHDMLKLDSTKRKKSQYSGSRAGFLCIDDIQLHLKPSETNSRDIELEDLEEQEVIKVDSTFESLPYILTLQNLNFKTNSSDLEGGKIKELEELIQFLLNNPKSTIRIEGHTDNVGDAYDNKMLSLNRALSVGDYIIDFGITAAQIKIVGLGDTAPIFDNDTAEGRRLNRRVEIKFQ